MPSRILRDHSLQGILGPEQTKPIVRPQLAEHDVGAAGTLAEDPLEKLARRSPFALAIARPDGDITYLPLRDGENLLGRGDAASVCIESADVSRRHALVTVSDGEVTIRDVGSSNHTYVEGIRLERDVPARIGHGTRLKLGGVRARLMHWVGKREG